jgi:hypothetical protein
MTRSLAHAWYRTDASRLSSVVPRKAASRETACEDDVMSEYADDRYLYASRKAWLVRLVLLLLTGAAVWAALDVRSGGPPAVDAPVFDAGRFWTVVGLFFIAGFAFGVAVRYPFPRPRIAWGRFVFVVAMLLPAVHVWFLLADPIAGAPEWLLGPYWFDQIEVADIGALLAGVGAASAIGARRKI